MPDIDIVVASPLWQSQPAAEDTVRNAIAMAAAARSIHFDEVSVLLADDDTVHALNRDWRGIDKPTNVLSFPAQRAVDAPQAALPTTLPTILGDIAIAYETLARECDAEGKEFLHHLAHLAVHGFLHLIGYDHETDSEAEEMEGIERAVMHRLGLPDPYPADDDRI